MAAKQSPAGLRQLAAIAFTDLLSSTTKEMENSLITTVADDDSEHQSVASFESEVEVQEKEKSSLSGEDISSLKDDNYRASAKVAMKVVDVRQYLDHVVPKEDLSALIMNHSISRAVNDNNVSLIRITIPSNVESLDFRSTDFWLGRTVVPGQFSQESDNHSGAQTSRWAVKLHGIEPPDEFDWFSWDRMGKIISMNEACELFSIMKMSQCPLTLKEFMVNARRAEYWACPKEQMPIFAETLLQMKYVTKFILRGLADDYMLQLIAKTTPVLKYLDISCSKYVTDKGILHLFFQTVKENSALYLIPSWVQKNLNTPLSHTLEYLDFSWTNITSLARKMVNLLPGSYMFKRHFAVTENEAFGHHVFVRKTPDLVTTIRQKEKDNKFQSELHSFGGKKGVVSFMKFTETHPWKNCHFAVFNYSPHLPSGNKADELDDSVSVGIITPSKEEKRIHGLVTFWQGNLTEIYSIFPINLNQLGISCPKLRILNGTVTDTWKNPGSLLPSLTDADMFGEPDSVISLLNSCPNLKKVRIRIIKKVLTDSALIHALSLSMSNRYLEELWIAPGSYKKGSTLLSEFDGKPGTSTMPSSDPSSATIPIREEESEKFAINSGTQQFHASSEQVGQSSDPRIEDLVQLSATCLRRLFESCKKLRRIGNLSWWNITDSELELISNELVKSNSAVNLLWDNIIIPGGCQFQNGRLVQL